MPWITFQHWIRGNGQYKQFVANGAAKIQLNGEIQWRYVPTDENPADLASRGGPIKSKELWEKGPKWLQDKSEWPENPVTLSSPASEEEAKVVKEVLNVAKTQEEDQFDHLLERVNLR